MARPTQYKIQRFAYVVLLVLLSVYFVSPFIIPIILAATVALTLYPYQVKLQKKNWKKGRAAALLTTGFTIVISIPFMFFLAKGTMLVIDLLEKTSVGDKFENQGGDKVFAVFKHNVIDKMLKFLAQFPFADFITEEKINTYLKSANVHLLGFFKSLATNIPSVVLFLIIMILCTFSFLNGAGGIRRFFQDLFGFSNRKMDQIVGVFLRDSRQVYLSNIVTGAFQSLMVATGVYFVTGADWFLVFFVTLIFSFVPVIGAAPIAFLFAVGAFFQGSTAGMIALIILGSITGVVDNVMRPWLASFGESKAPAIVSFVFVIGGAILLGFPGLFIGLLVGAIVYDTLPIFWEEIETGRTLPGFFSFGGDKSKGEEEISKQ
jgi:predicted PurR-regulated permease PerM